MPPDQRAALWIIDGAWLAWATFWIAMARRTKQTIRREAGAERALYVTLGMAGALIMLGPGLHDTPLHAQILSRAFWMAWAGAACTVSGVAFTLWARVVLAGNWSGTVTVKQNHELIRTGPYSLVRHPIYTGLLTALIGTGIAIDRWRAVLGIALILAAFLRKMRTEEIFMAATFGPAYAEYRATTPALIPRLR